MIFLGLCSKWDELLDDEFKNLGLPLDGLYKHKSDIADGLKADILTWYNAEKAALANATKGMYRGLYVHLIYYISDDKCKNIALD